MYVYAHGVCCIYAINTWTEHLFIAYEFRAIGHVTHIYHIMHIIIRIIYYYIILHYIRTLNFFFFVIFIYDTLYLGYMYYREWVKGFLAGMAVMWLSSALPRTVHDEREMSASARW